MNARKYAAALKRYAAETEAVTPFRQPNWIARTAAKLGAKHPLFSIFRQAAANGGRVQGRVMSMGHQKQDEDMQPEDHDLGDGVTASIRRHPMPESKGFENVHVTLTHRPTGRTGEFSINRRTE